ncbi:Uncharacterised protein [Mycolicibacterium vanbaalenii]|uniref:Uncharacterized protein n=1 Tax=Mycolicibacterium vanbaalenii TaxID=110539 RepID=A0A5S9NG04_MYCVN|nr:Uncharacterised protein [Mycolicibacterium vanbaalenii]
MVLVERHTEHQISIQWLEDAETVCLEFARRAGCGEHSPNVVACAALRLTIAQEVTRNAIGITPRTHPPTPTAGGAS